MIPGWTIHQASLYASLVMSHPRPFYYLENFCTALVWLAQRYGDLLSASERTFIGTFQRLPRESGALLVRMIGRKGELFRTGKLNYSEIGSVGRAAGPLIELGWVDPQPRLVIAELGRVLRKAELQAVCRVSGAALTARKSELLRMLEGGAGPPRRLLDWWPDAPDAVYRLAVNALCEQLRVVFFGNFHQDWSQFVLTDLGIFKYEKVASDSAARAFRTRAHIETFHALFSCRQCLEEDADIGAVLAAFPSSPVDNEWLEARRRKLQFQIAQCCERRRELPRALDLYRNCSYPGARLRVIRLLERQERFAEAFDLAARIRQDAADEVEVQQLERMWPRLQRNVGLIPQRSRLTRGWLTFELTLPEATVEASEEPQVEARTRNKPSRERQVRVEQLALEALSRPDAPVHYVENGLINSLFGLLCWDAIFAPIPGAFFHEFQAAPADLHAPGFSPRRATQFARCFEQLESDAYRDTIWRNFELKDGIQSPFVFWGVLTETLLHHALACLPREHLKVCFQRILLDIRTNRSGLPDLVQFWPQERRYRLIEVKGPGDRLRDNQIRWLNFCVSQAIPVAVCHVRWVR